MPSQSGEIVLINGFGVLFVILNAFGLGLRLPIGKILGEAAAHWKIVVWALVVNFVLIPVLFIGYLLTVASSIPGEIKVGFCVAALCAGMPFAPILAKLAKANVSIATTLLVVMTVATVIALPIGLPLAVDAVDAQLTTSFWDVAWPLLLFLVLPLALGCCFRIGWPDLTAPLAQVGGPGRNLVSSVQPQLHPGCVLGSIRADMGHRKLHRSHRRPVHRPWVCLPSRFRSPGQRRRNQARNRNHHGGPQHRPDAADDDLPLRR